MEENAESDARTGKVKKMLEDKETYSDLKMLGWINDDIRSLYREIDDKRLDAFQLKIKLQKDAGMMPGNMNDEMILMTAANVLFDMEKKKPKV